MRQKIIGSILFFFVFMIFGKTVAQQTIQVQGCIKDSITNEALPYVTVTLHGTTKGTATDENGYFSIKTISAVDSVFLSISYVGYEAKLVSLGKGVNNVNILLNPVAYELNEVTVRPGREKYSKKENPAVAFARHVIARRKLNNPYEHDYFSYNAYERRTFANNDIDVESVRRNRIYKRIDFIFDYVDSTSVGGKTILPLYDEEILEDYFFRKSPHTERKVLKGAKRAGIIEVMSEDGVRQFVDEAFSDVDIFQDNIQLFLNRFVSPLSSIGPDYYKYYLLDTVLLDGEACMDLGFVPFNSESFGFVGHLYVTLDSTYFVKKVNLNIPGNINLNFVGEMSVNQEYLRTDDGVRLLTKNDIALTFKLTKKMKGFYARRVALYRNHSFDKPPDMKVFDEKAPVLESEDAHSRTENFWDEAREGAGEMQPSSVEKMMAQLREIPFLYWSEKLINILVNGYIQTSETNSLFEFGPANTFISGNALEGARLRLGGATTVNLSRRFFIDGYLAYGLKDHKPKGDAIIEYSFNKKKNFRKEYPFHYIRAEYRYDINQIGQHYLYTNTDNLFVMLKRRKNNLITYMRKAELSYYKENYKGLGYRVLLRHLTEWATPDVRFDMIRADGTVAPVDHYRSAQLEFYLRWAPNEKFYQSRNYRHPITLDAPVVTLSHVMARKGVLGSDHNYNRTEIGVRKRFWISPFGYVDLYGQAGKVWNRVPYPLLHIPNANLSYSIQPESYPLMNPMEFINDRFVSWEMSYFMNGWLFNRLPLVKGLQLREVLTFRGWYGSLSDKNNPQIDGAGLYKLPENTYMMGNKPYMEIGAGVENILKVIRLDYIWRLSYRGHEGAPNSGLRMKLKFSF
ncbi:MAG: DUF5686 and carboxypeptidase regulatory-like domain-containing protein [Tannerella sp.]|jgi:hypothetical protein|nr:DUF5686 and carboxypeptidase regulatory-like domain-containing protein [Tannerella sp.]